MKCLACGNNVGSDLMQSSFMPQKDGSLKQISICIRCFVLVSSLDTLKRIEKLIRGGLNVEPGRSKLQINN